MAKGPSDKAKHVIALIKNCGDLAVIHRRITEARDVFRAARMLCSEFGFDIPEEMLDSIDYAILEKPPQALAETLMVFMNDIKKLS